MTCSLCGNSFCLYYFSRWFRVVVNVEWLSLPIKNIFINTCERCIIQYMYDYGFLITNIWNKHRTAQIWLSLMHLHILYLKMRLYLLQDHLTIGNQNLWIESTMYILFIFSLIFAFKQSFVLLQDNYSRVCNSWYLGIPCSIRCIRKGHIQIGCWRQVDHRRECVNREGCRWEC